MFASTFSSDDVAVDFGFTRARQLGGVWRKALSLAGLNEHRASGLDMLRLMGRQARAWLSRVRPRLALAYPSGSSTQLVQSLSAQPLGVRDLQRVTALRASSLADERSWLFRHPLWWSVALLVLSFQLPKLMTQTEDVAVMWTPPIEPPGVVVVTANSADSGAVLTPLQADSRSFTGTPAPSPTARPQGQPASVQSAKLATVESPKPLTPGTAAADTQKVALRLALDQWSQAWRQQNMSGYLGMYDPNFATPPGLSRSAWEKLRTTRIMGKKKIIHEIHDLTVQMEGSTAVVTFTQIYADERMKMTDLKTVHWVQRDGRWLITREISG